MTRRGPIAWMVHHGVAPNLLMVLLLVGGLLASLAIKKEVFPDFELEIVNVAITYTGATPEEVERSLLLPMEAALANVDGIDEMSATANEGAGRISLSLVDGVDVMRVYQDIQQAINAITILPAAADPPRFSIAGRERSVMNLQVHGWIDERLLHEIGEELRAELQASPGISRVELSGSREREIQVLLDAEAMHRHGFDHRSLANRITEEAMDLASGRLTTAEGEWLIRYQGRRDEARDFAELPIVGTVDGGQLRLGDIAHIVDGFAESDREVLYNGAPALSLEVYQIGNQTPLGISDAVHAQLERLRAGLPEGVSLSVSRDTSEIYRDRLDLLLKNAWLGLALVLVLMALFMEARLAFSVTLGIPTAFLRAMLFLPWLGVAINSLSMFAFIIALGIVVDDAIIVGENIHSYREQGHSLRDAAVRGARELAVPISFAILTNIVAFLPLLFLPGFLGMIFAVVPVVVITIFLVSWLEALFSLPAHLAHRSGKHKSTPWQRPLERLRHTLQEGLNRFTYHRFEPFLQRALDQRLLTVSLAVALLMVSLAWAMSGRMGFSLMPRAESDQVQATVTLPVGSPIADDRAIRDRLLDAAETLAERGDGPAFTSSRAQIDGDRLSVRLTLDRASLDAWPPSRVAREWRALAGEFSGAQAVRFESDVGGPGAGAALTLRLSHPDSRALEGAATRLSDALGEFEGVTDIDSGLADVNPQLEIRLSPVGRALGLTGADLAGQLRAPLQGITALEQFVGRHEISVEVRLPAEARRSLADLERLPIRTPEGRQVPLARVADLSLGRAATTLERIDGRRIISVTADAAGEGRINQVMTTLEADVFPALQAG